MSIRGVVEEINQLKIEIKRNLEINKKYRTRIKELEKVISVYLEEKNQPGLKYKGSAIILENKVKTKTKPKKEIEKDVISLFEELGIDNPSKVYDKLLNLRKGSPVDSKQILIKKIKK